VFERKRKMLTRGLQNDEIFEGEEIVRKSLKNIGHNLGSPKLVDVNPAPEDVSPTCGDDHPSILMPVACLQMSIQGLRISVTRL
jgi:hypothetical protein